MNTNATVNPSQNPEVMRKVRQRLIQLGIQALILGAVLFVSAGRMDWIWAWVYLATFVLGFSVNGFILWKRNPELIAERAGTGQGTKGWDSALVAVYGLLASLGLQLVAGLDHRFGWSPPFPASIHLAALVVSLLGFAFSSWAMIENAYFATTVRIQVERGHRVCTSGPYRYVRHPGYCGWSVGLFATPILLGSLWALIPGGVAVALLVIRTALEDRTLQAELDGYWAYAQQTRYRLVPGIW
jgi:protein-S-isoprenylcysteine O-methyltransferase Ste14